MNWKKRFISLLHEVLTYMFTSWGRGHNASHINDYINGNGTWEVLFLPE